MLVYWLMFLVPAVAAITSDKDDWKPGSDTGSSSLTPSWVLVGVLLALLVGYRYEVGGDWFTYIGYSQYVTYATLSEVFTLPDPGFMLLNWLALEIGWGNIGVNVFGGIIFSVGIISFCRSLPRPWLGLAVAVPYLVVVVGMGYARQGIALSLAMLGLLALQRGSILRFFIWVLLGATFHKTAVMLLPIAALASPTNRFWSIVWVLIITVLAYFELLADSIDSLYKNYIVAQFQSQGAFIRLLMIVLPAALLLTKPFPLRPAEMALWRLMALISFALFIALFVISSSTVVDRIALYMLPLQIVVFSYLPEAWAPHNKVYQRRIVLFILMYYTVVLAVWLFFASHSQYWLPYRFYPIEWAFGYI